MVGSSAFCSCNDGTLPLCRGLARGRKGFCAFRVSVFLGFVRVQISAWSVSTSDTNFHGNQNPRYCHLPTVQYGGLGQLITSFPGTIARNSRSPEYTCIHIRHTVLAVIGEWLGAVCAHLMLRSLYSNAPLQLMPKCIIRFNPSHSVLPQLN
jgi:hypothetical protein